MQEIAHLEKHSNPWIQEIHLIPPVRLGLILVFLVTQIVFKLKKRKNF